MTFIVLNEVGVKLNVSAGATSSNALGEGAKGSVGEDCGSELARGGGQK